jgi:hypothetical protein
MMIVNTANETYAVDLVNFVVTVGKSSITLDGSGAETYVEMHKAVISGQSSAMCSASEAIETDKLIASIEKAAEERVWVSR